MVVIGKRGKRKLEAFCNVRIFINSFKHQVQFLGQCEVFSVDLCFATHHSRIESLHSFQVILISFTKY